MTASGVGAGPRLFTFDCYGTLVDWETGILRAFRERFPEAARRDDAQLITAYHRAEAAVEDEVTDGGFVAYREVLWDTACRVAGRFGWNLRRGDGNFLADTLPDWPVFPDTRGALERLRGLGCRLAIVSNVDDDLLAGTVERIGVPFDALITAEQVESYKPTPPHFRRAVEEAGGADRLFHLAQSWYHDVRPARELGLRVVWVNRKGEEPPSGPDEPEPTAEVADMAAAAAWMEERFGRGGSLPDGVEAGRHDGDAAGGDGGNGVPSTDSS